MIVVWSDSNIVIMADTYKIMINVKHSFLKSPQYIIPEDTPYYLHSFIKEIIDAGKRMVQFQKKGNSPRKSLSTMIQRQKVKYQFNIN